MKVFELIKVLQLLPVDARVLVQGYESGYDDIVYIEERPVLKNAGAADYNGEYDDAEDSNASKAVVILGNRK